MGRGTAGTRLTALFLCSLLFTAMAPNACAARARVLKDGPFVAHFPDSIPQADVEQVLDQFKSARKKLGKYFNRQFNGRLEIQVHATTAEFTSATGFPWWIGAAWVKGRMHLQPPRVLMERGVLASTVTHEYSHFALRQAAGGKTPLWLDEGFATYMSGEFDIEFGKDKKKFRFDGTLEQLDKALAQTRDKDKAAGAYRASFAIVRFMHGRFGDAKVLAVLTGTGKTGKFDETLKKVTGIDSATLLSLFRKNNK